MTAAHLPNIRDIRQEAGGGVSFIDPATHAGVMGDDGRTKLTPAQAKATFDRTYRLNNLEQAVAEQYNSDRVRPVSMIDSMKGSLSRKLRGALSSATSSPANSSATLGVLSALTGGAAAYALSGQNPIRNGLLAALAAGGAGYALSGGLRKNANAVDDLLKAVKQDSNLSESQTQILIERLRRISSTDAGELKRLLGAAKGAGAGAVIAKFFGLPWFWPTAIGGLIGFANSAQPKRRNAFGQTLLL